MDLLQDIRLDWRVWLAGTYNVLQPLQVMKWNSYKRVKSVNPFAYMWCLYVVPVTVIDWVYLAPLAGDTALGRSRERGRSGPSFAYESQSGGRGQVLDMDSRV